MARNHTRQHVLRIAISLAEKFGHKYEAIKGMTFRQVLRMVEAMGYQVPWNIYNGISLNTVL